MTTTKPDIDVLALKLAGAKKPCPCINDPDGPNRQCDMCGGLTSPHASSCETPDCKGTGEVFVLPKEVRVECDRCHLPGHNHINDPCNGRGYMVLDPEKTGRWMVALRFTNRNIYIHWDTHYKQWVGVVSNLDDHTIHVKRANDPELTLLTAGCKALGLDIE